MPVMVSRGASISRSTAPTVMSTRPRSSPGTRSRAVMLSAVAHYINPGLLLQIAAALRDQGYGPQRALAVACLADVDALIDRRQADFHALTQELVLIRLGATASHDEHVQAARRGLRTLGAG